ncbi:MAG: hypothetical protein ABIA59_11330, partial [Candidatus Latescibacterota bacterium]
MRDKILSGAILLIAALGIFSCLDGGLFPAGSAAAYLLLMIVPGILLQRFFDITDNPLEIILSGLILSPVLAGLACMIGMVAGLSAAATALVVATLISAMALLFALRRHILRDDREFSGAQMAVLAAVIGVFCALVGFLLLPSEYWRLHSDGWFHAAVVSQIADYGIPPQDPYFYDLPLQYFWVYHVLVLVTSQAAKIDPTLVMAFINIQGLAGFCLASFLLSVHYRKRFFHGISSMLVAVLGMNALFWLFLPVKLLRVFTGDVRGTEEASRILTLSPLNIETARRFLDIYFNRQYLLDKFIVITAFSLGLALTAAAWYGATRSLANKNAFPLLFTFLVFVGLVAFHTVAALIMLVGFGGGFLLLTIHRFHSHRRIAKRSMLMILILFASVIIMSPYLYLVTHGKESGGLLPFAISFERIAGLVITCALVMILAAFQWKKIAADRSHEARFFMFATLTTLIFCVLVILPGPNTYDKPPFFVFFPLAIAGGWTLAELTGHSRSFLRNKAMIAAIFILLLMPTNLIAMLGYFYTPTGPVVTACEADVAAWVRTNTPRDAIIIDSDDRVFLLVAGPRRYYYGRHGYAVQWNYRNNEMARRRAVVSNIYQPGPLGRSTLAALSAIEPKVYVIERKGESGTNSGDDFTQRQTFMNLVYTTIGCKFTDKS